MRVIGRCVFSGRLIVLGYIVGQGPAVLAFFLSSILSSFVFSLSPQTRLGLTSADTDWPDYNVVDWAFD